MLQPFRKFIAAMVLLTPAISSAQIDIVFDYTYDTNNFFSGANVGRRTILEAAATMFESHLASETFGSITPSGSNHWTFSFLHPTTGAQQNIPDPVIPANEVRIYVGARNLGSGLLGLADYAYSISGSGAWLQEFDDRNSTTNFDSLGGAIAFNTTKTFYFDDDVNTVEAFPNQFDLYSVALHEIGHLLGISAGSLAFETKTSGTNFNGAACVALFGGAVPLDPGDLSHFAQSVTSNAQTCVMVPSLLANQRRFFTPLDFAALKDIGYVVDGDFGVLAATDDVVQIRSTSAVTIPVLANDTTPIGQVLQITNVVQPTKGTATLVNGGISYKPGAMFDGSDSFTYTISAGGNSDDATVTIENPFIPLFGRFFQFAQQNSNSVGTINVTLSKTGTVSGQIKVNGKTYKLTGSVALDGSYTKTFKRKGLSDLVVNLTFALNGGTPQVTGTATGDTDPYVFNAGDVAVAGLPVGITAGKYTMILPPDGNVTNPRGTGYATMKVATTGVVTVSGKLGDATPFSTTTYLQADGEAPIFVPLYVKPKGVLTGVIQFQALAQSDCTGTLTWNKPVPEKPTGLFPGGFTATTAASGALFVPPLTGVRSLTYGNLLNSRGAAHFVDGNLVGNVDAQFGVSTADKVTVDLPNSNAVKISINRATGIFSGSFKPAADQAAKPFKGVLHQKLNSGAGYFKGATQTGTATLVPE